MLCRLYLRASTDEQDATRARVTVETFAAERGLVIAGAYIENESGAKLARPELFRLLADSRPGDVLLIEQVDRLSRLTNGDWQKLRAELDAKQVRVVRARPAPTSWMLASDGDMTSPGACSGPSTACCSTCSQQSRARITRIVAAGRPKDRPRRRPRGNTAAAPRTPPGTPASPRSYEAADHGPRSRKRRVARGRPSPRSPSAPLRRTVCSAQISRAVGE